MTPNSHGLPPPEKRAAMARTVLLVEDNEENRYLATFLLKAKGYEVAHAAHGGQALEMGPRLRPDIILLDIQLPVMDGYELARAFRGMESLRHTVIIAVTGYAMTGDREKALSAGCDGYIEKPINPETFVAEVERLAQPR